MKLLVATLLLGVLIALGLFLRTPGGSAAIPNTVKAVHADPAQAVEVPVGAEARVEKLERSAIAETDEAVGVQEDEALLAVAVRVVLDEATDETALEGVLVQLHVGNTKRRDWVEHRTNVEGHAQFELSASARIWSARVATGPRSAAHEEYLDRGVKEAHASGIELRVSSGATLSGRVVNREGLAVANAELRVWCTTSYEATRKPDLTGIADESGAFELSPMPARFFLSASAPGLACERGLRGTLRTGSHASDLEVLLSPEAWIEGTVLDSSGRPVEACDLRVHAAGGTSSRDSTHVADVWRFYPVSVASKSGVDGRFRLGPVPARSWNVHASHAHHLPSDKALQPDVLDQVIVLRAAATLVGRIFGHDGEPVPGARLRTQLRGEFSGRGQSREDGRYEMRGLVPGEGFLGVHAAGHRVAIVPIEVTEGHTTSRDVRLERPLRIAGTVLDVDGVPVSGARLHITGGRVIEVDTDYGEPTTLQWLFGLHQRRADAEGRFAFEDLEPGSFTLNVASPDAPLERVQLAVRAGEADLRIVLDRSATERVVLTGRVFAARDGEPVKRFQLLPMVIRADGSGRGQFVEVEDSEGRFRSAGHDPGTYTLTARSEGFASWRSEELVLAEGDHTFEIALHETRSIELEFVDAKGEPLHIAAMVTFAHEGRPVWFSFLDGSSATAFVLDGKVRAHGLPAVVLTATVTMMMTSEKFEHVLDLRIQPHEPIRIVVEVKPQFQVHSILMGTKRHDVETMSLADSREGWLFDGELVAKFYTSNDQQLGAATVRSLGDGVWELKTSTMNSSSSEPDARGPMLTVHLEGAATRMDLTAEGYHPRTITLDALSPNGGVPDTIFLRRAD